MNRDYLISAFQNGFEGTEAVPTAIYGVSPATQEVLSVAEAYDIKGLLDGIMQEGEMYGMPILTLDKVVEIGISRIIIVARAASVKIVFNRIREFAAKHEIAVFDVNGTNLFDRYVLSAGEGKFYGTFEEIKSQIDKYDVISFDIFDTVLMRKVLQPTDIFEIVERKVPGAEKVNFAVNRRKAELDLVFSGTYPTYTEVYEKLQKDNDLPKELTDHLKACEYETERRNLIAREMMKKVYEYAISSGKKVFFVSDMYYTSTDLADFLADAGITGYEKIIVSSEHRIMKNGGLFRVLLELTKGQKVLHIGDNPDADVDAANDSGIASYKIMSAYEMLERSSYSTLLSDTDSLENRVAIGLLIANVFNNPFILTGTDGRSKIERCEDFSYFFVAPYILTYMEWLVENSRTKNIDAILFMARDGYLLNKLYASYFSSRKNAPKALYFLISRFPASVIKIKNQTDILKTLSSGYDGTPEELLEKRFFLEKSEIKARVEGESRDEFILRHADAILAAAADVRKKYAAYFESLGLSVDGKYAVMDLAASGSCQLALQQLMKERLTGYYFVHIVDDKKDKIDIESLFKITNWFKKDASICEYYVLFESILTSYNGTFWKFDKDLNPLYCDDSRTEAEFKNLTDMQNAVDSYFADYKAFLDCAAPSKELSDKILGLVQMEKSDISMTGISSGVLEDDFFKRKYSMKEIIV